MSDHDSSRVVRQALGPISGASRAKISTVHPGSESEAQTSARSGRPDPSLGRIAVILTAADRGYFPLLRDMVSSIRRFEPGRRFPIGVFDLGLEREQIAWLEQREVSLTRPRQHFGLPEEFGGPFARACLVRPFLYEYFDGYDFYFWIDADAWLQSWEAIDLLLDGASRCDLAIVHERERAYRFQAWLVGWNIKHAISSCGLAHGALVLSRPQLNDGVFCLRAKAPHWKLWQQRFQRAVERNSRGDPNDQFSLNEVIYADRPPVSVLDPVNNWICDRAPPVWDEAAKCFCKPYPPYEPIAVMHLAGPAKREVYRIRTRAGDWYETRFTFEGALPSFLRT
ncbi:MAG: hypothetical protein ACM30D_11465 [Hyphomicrobiales bacterium]